MRTEIFSSLTHGKNGERMSHTYSYGGQSCLTPVELFFLIACEETCAEVGLDDAEAMILILTGWPFIPTRAKPKGATKNTSIASLWARSTFRYEFRKKILPTFTFGSIKRLRWILTHKLSTFIGRTLPGVGWVLLAGDAYQIVYHTVSKYNRIVSPEDRVF
jgi:hypothetical protein